jgi:hypothetical protein
MNANIIKVDGVLPYSDCWTSHTTNRTVSCCLKGKLGPTLCFPSFHGIYMYIYIYVYIYIYAHTHIYVNICKYTYV